jgi:hypothetical protein
MPNYNESNVNSTSYQRAKSATISNVYGQNPEIMFNEELVVVLPDGAAHRDLGNVFGTFTPENKDTVVTLIDPDTGDNTANTMTYGEIYTAIRSLYLHLAIKRDTDLAALEAAKQAAIAAVESIVASSLADVLAAKAAAEAALADVNAAISANDPVAALAAAQAAQNAANVARAAATIALGQVTSSNASAQALSDSNSAQTAATEAETVAADAATAAASIQPAP